MCIIRKITRLLKVYCVYLKENYQTVKGVLCITNLLQTIFSFNHVFFYDTVSSVSLNEQVCAFID